MGPDALVPSGAFGRARQLDIRGGPGGQLETIGEDEVRRHERLFQVHVFAGASVDPSQVRHHTIGRVERLDRSGPGCEPPQVGEAASHRVQMAVDLGGPVGAILAHRHVGLLGGAQIGECEGQGPGQVGENTLDVLLIVERQFGESDLIAGEPKRGQCHDHDGDPNPATPHPGKLL